MPTAFRPISGARGFATRQKLAWKKEDMLRFTRGSDNDFGGSLETPGTRSYHYLCSGDTFAFDVEPYLALIGNRSAVGTGAAAANGLAGGAEQLREEVDDEIESSDDGGAW